MDGVLGAIVNSLVAAKNATFLAKIVELTTDPRVHKEILCQYIIYQNYREMS
jgi:hypothetical protein